MQKTLALLLAASILASSMTACGNTLPSPDTAASETKAVETGTPETHASETASPEVSYNTSLVTENGIAKAHIVVADGAEQGVIPTFFLKVVIKKASLEKPDRLAAVLTLSPARSSAAAQLSRR